jgi:hypothetical protein
VGSRRRTRLRGLHEVHFLSKERECVQGTRIVQRDSRAEAPHALPLGSSKAVGGSFDLAIPAEVNVEASDIINCVAESQEVYALGATETEPGIPEGRTQRRRLRASGQPMRESSTASALACCGSAP